MKIPSPWRTAMDLVADSGLSGTAEDVVELVENIAQHLQDSYTKGYEKRAKEDDL